MLEAAGEIAHGTRELGFDPVAAPRARRDGPRPEPEGFLAGMDPTTLENGRRKEGFEEVEAHHKQISETVSQCHGRVHSRARKTLEVVLAHRLHLGLC